MKLISILAASVALLALGCKGGGDSSATAGTSSSAGPSAPAGDATVVLDGSGATFPNPLYQKWIQEYARSHPNVKINYQSVGSGAGIRAITDRTVDFGASDAPMSDDQLAKAGGKLLHVPTTLGAVAVTYNVAGAPDRLRFSPELVAGMFLGDIRRWNDAKIAALNPGAKLPDQGIGVVYRADGSGTTAVFTDYLSKVSADWKSKVGTGTSVKWPAGTGANKNDGVANQIKQTPGAVGYIELAYAVQTRQPTASLQNKAGKFVEPSLDAITAAAAASAARVPADLRVSITDAEGDGAYPISAFTYVLVYQDMPDVAKARTLTEFLWWATHDGQKLGAPLQYAPLPAEIVQRDEAALRSLTSGGKPVLGGR